MKTKVLQRLFRSVALMCAMALGIGSAWAAVGDNWSSTTAGEETAAANQASKSQWTLKIPATENLPAGTLINITKITLGSRYATDASAALNDAETRILEINGVKSTEVTAYSGTLTAGANSTVAAVEFNFSNLKVCVGASKWSIILLQIHFFIFIISSRPNISIIIFRNKRHSFFFLCPKTYNFFISIRINF